MPFEGACARTRRPTPPTTLPVLLGQRERVAVPRRRDAGAARAPGARPRHVGPGAVRRAGRGRAGAGRPGADPDARRVGWSSTPTAGWSASSAGTLPAAPARVRRRLDRLHRLSVKPGLYVPALAARLHRRVAGLERRYGRPVADRGPARGRAGGGRVRAQPGDAARARARLPRRPAAGHAGRRRQRHPAGRRRPAARRRGCPRSPPGGSSRRRARCCAASWSTPPARRFVRRVPLRRGDRRRAWSRAAGRAWLLVGRADHGARPAASCARQTLWFQRLQAWYLLRWSPRPRRLGRRGRAAGPASSADGLAATVAAYGPPRRTTFGKAPVARAARCRRRRTR